MHQPAVTGLASAHVNAYSMLHAAIAEQVCACAAISFAEAFAQHNLVIATTSAHGVIAIVGIDNVGFVIADQHVIIF